MDNKIQELVKEIINAGNSALKDATDIANKDLQKLSGFSKRQVEGIAQLSITVARGLKNGEIPEDQKDFQLNRIKDISMNFVRTLVGITIVTIEKMYNAIISAIWKFIGGIAGILL